MGNEHSKSKEITKNGTIHEKHENGSANGLSANITSNGLEIAVNGETILQQNGEPFSLNLATESTEPEFVIVESESPPVEAPIISETPEPTIPKEEIKKSKGEKVRLFGKMFKKKAEPPAVVESVQEKEMSNEDETDVSSSATDPQPELNSSGEEAAYMIITEHQEEVEYPHEKAERSTQTDIKTEADISTQTGNDDNTTVNSGGPEEATTEEDALNESVVIIAEEAVEETVNEEPSDNQTAGIISEDMAVTENNVYEDIMFRAERVEVTDNFEICHCNTAEESITVPEETEPEILTEPEEIVVEESKDEETVTWVVSSLPKVVADCVEAVFAAVSESTDYTSVNTSEPRVDEVITDDKDEGAGDMSADVVLIEPSEPEPNVVTPEVGEENGVPSLDEESGEGNDVPSPDEESMTMVMETISQISHEEPNPPPANQDTSVEEPPALLETETLIKEESAHEEVTTDDAAAGDVSEISQQDELSPVTDNESSEKCDSCPEEQIIIVEVSSNELIITEEFPEDSPDGEVEPESILEVTATDETAEIGEDVISDVGPETGEESEPSSAVISEGDEVIPEAVINVLSEEFELIATIPEDPAADNDNPLEEEVIAATVFVPLCGEQEVSLTIPEEPIEETIIQTKDEAVVEPNVVTPEVGEENGVPSLDEESGEGNDVPSPDEESVTMVMETISEISHEEPNPPPANQDTSVEEPPALLETETLIKEEFAHEEVTTDDAAAGDVSEISQQDELVEEMNDEAIEALSNEFEAVPETVEEDTAVQESSTEGEVVEVTISEEPTEDSDMAEEKTEVSDGVLAQTESTETPEQIPLISEEPAEKNPSPCEEDAIIEVLENTLETVVEAISEVIENTVEEPEDVQVDVPPMEATEEPEPCVSVQDEENVAPAEALLEDPDPSPVVEVEVVDPVDSEEPAEESEHQPQTEVLMVILEKTEDEVTEDTVHETDNSDDASAAVEENSGTVTLDEPVAECVEAVLQAIVEEIITEEAECTLVTLEEAEPEIIAKEETEEKAENESSVHTTDSTMDSQSAEISENTSVTSTDMEALLARLQSACTSVVEESVYSIGGLEISSLGDTIIITIHVDPKTEQQ
ncbi:breast carcinoma-amplified sequence 1 isoform X1 [Trachinotus anak]|uniref:breast carcinoma-amplified sequence 1 isoform X1 n=1 Tax=Trachinotus anak TaxID=443729 RepID=UPI0039F2366D